MLDLTGVCVGLTITDPWELVTDIGSGPFKCRVVNRNDDNELVLKLESPFLYESREYRYVIAGARHDHESLDDLARARAIHVSGTAIGAIGDVSGLPLIGDLQPLSA